MAQLEWLQCKVPPTSSKVASDILLDHIFIDMPMPPFSSHVLNNLPISSATLTKQKIGNGSCRFDFFFFQSISDLNCPSSVSLVYEPVSILCLATLLRDIQQQTQQDTNRLSSLTFVE